MNTLIQLKDYSKFLESLLEETDLTEFDEIEERRIINTFPERIGDNLDLALDFTINNNIPEHEGELRILVEILHYLDVDKIKDLYKIVFN